MLHVTYLLDPPVSYSAEEVVGDEVGGGEVVPT
jgi:hypothetical protein